MGILDKPAGTSGLLSEPDNPLIVRSRVGILDKPVGNSGVEFDEPDSPVIDKSIEGRRESPVGISGDKPVPERPRTRIGFKCEGSKEFSDLTNVNGDIVPSPIDADTDAPNMVLVNGNCISSSLRFVQFQVH